MTLVFAGFDTFMHTPEATEGTNCRALFSEINDIFCFFKTPSAELFNQHAKH